VKIGVQHHHAQRRLAARRARVAGADPGVAYDGTGFGTDGTLWGGEILLATLEGYERVASFRSLALPGGERAIREVWRTALALLDDAYAGDPPLERLPLFAGVTSAEIAVVRQMQAEGLNCPRARGVGRYFDAFGALGLGRARSAHEGQIALLWNLAADPCESERYDYGLDARATPWEIDLRPAVRQAVDDLVAGRGAGVVSARFHRTLAAATAEAVRLAAERAGRLAVGLSGGCFQNPLLVEQVVAALDRTSWCCVTARFRRRRRDRPRPGGRGGCRGTEIALRDRGRRACAWVCRDGGVDRRPAGHRGLLGRAAGRTARPRRPAGSARRLRAQPRRLRDPAHPAEDIQGTLDLYESLLGEGVEGDLMAPTCAARSRRGRSLVKPESLPPAPRS